MLPAELVRKDGVAKDSGSFAHSLRLGAMVGRFMIDAYRRIQGGLGKGGGASRITPEDMTRLGRRIAVNFATSGNKVAVVPFLSEDLRFTELYFYAEKAPGKRTIWAVKGKEKNAGKATVESLDPIRRDTEPARLLAWLSINGIALPGQTVHAEKSLAPIAILDMQSLLVELAAFFPPQETLIPDMDEYLKPERVTRVYLVLNLPVAPDKNKIMHAAVLYATNWGELCCQSFDNPDALLAKAPLQFLQANLAKPITGPIETKVFTPKKSACPKLKIL
jgi:adenylate cyclase class 1